MRRGSNPARTQDRGDIEEQDVPEAHLLAQLFDGIGRAAGRRRPGRACVRACRAHKVTSNEGIRSSCRRKFLRNGSVEFSKSAQGPKRVTLPSWRNTTTSASFFAGAYRGSQRLMSCE